MSSFSAAVRGCCCCCCSSSLRLLLGSSPRRYNCKKLLKSVVSWRNRWYTHKADGLGEKPGLKEFINAAVAHGVSSTGDRAKEEEDDIVPYLTPAVVSGQNRRVYFETYGCQMNVNDTDIAWTVLKNAGFQKTDEINQADVILVVTCAIRDNAESKIWNRLNYFRKLKMRRKSEGVVNPPLRVGVLGCMAERLKEKLLETDKMVDIVAGPDSYRDLPRLLSVTDSGQAAVNVLLSLDETYADIIPVRVNASSPTAYVSVMRGCDNMCSFCIVPFTRGRERSRPIQSILDEVRMLSDEGVKEVTLLGQNVNSYRDTSSSSIPLTHPLSTHLSAGFSSIYHNKEGGRRFADLLDKVAQVDPEIRIRFTSPHPKDFPNELLQVMRDHQNVCKHVHLPVQSGSSRILKLMRRGHTREAYLQLVESIRATLPGVTLSSDFIVGFCGEEEEDHRHTLSLMSTVQYDMAYMFAYSMRKKTHAYHRMMDDVPEEVKMRRLREVITLFHSLVAVSSQQWIGTEQLVLVKGRSRRSEEEFVGLTDGNIKCVFPDKPIPHQLSNFSCPSSSRVSVQPGDYVVVKVTDTTSLTLRGEPVCRTSLTDYSKWEESHQHEKELSSIDHLLAH